MSGLEKVLLSWDEFGKLSEDFAKRINEKYNGGIDAVIGIAKGGLILSVDVANHLGTEWDSIRIQSYRGDAIRVEPHLIYDLHGSISGKTVLLVDDIVDGGATMEFALDYLNKTHHPKKIITASLILKPHSSFKPDEYALERTEWMVFPWEAKKK